ncbi:hypothetical protein A9W94_20910 [Mycobacterium asiaticum]|nr:hypothetical protein A9W94_20910 [Mycobacterium asiaticum]
MAAVAPVAVATVVDPHRRPVAGTVPVVAATVAGPRPVVAAAIPAAVVPAAVALAAAVAARQHHPDKVVGTAAPDLKDAAPSLRLPNCVVA